MSYDYQVERKELFTEDGQVHFLKVRDQVKNLLRVAGAFRFDSISISGTSWTTIAAVDRLVELMESRVMNWLENAEQSQERKRKAGTK